MDRVNGTMYGKFSVGYKIISERVMILPQYQQTPVENQHRPTYTNTLPGIADIATPVAKSTSVTQASQMPVLTNVPLLERDRVVPISNERARATYLDQQIQDMSSVRLPLNIPSMEEESSALPDLSEFVPFVRNKRRKENRNGNQLDNTR